MEPVKICFDMDGTLIHQIGFNEDTPKYENIELFHHFQRMGCEMFIWSGSGVDYAVRWAQKLGLTATVVEKGSFKPDIAVDDMAVTLGKVNLKVAGG